MTAMSPPRPGQMPGVRTSSYDRVTFEPPVLTRMRLGVLEQCSTRTVLGDGQEHPVVLAVPVVLAPAPRAGRAGRLALARGARYAGVMATAGGADVLRCERTEAASLALQLHPDRSGIGAASLAAADALELVLGHDLHPDFFGPDDLRVKLEELREATAYRVPLAIRLRATRPYLDVAVAVKAGFDVVVLETAESCASALPGSAASSVGVPAIAALPAARRALDESAGGERVSLVACGGVRSGADVAKALALGADCVAIGAAALDVLPLAVYPGDDAHGHPEPAAVEDAARGVAALVERLGRDAAAIARRCGKSNVHHLDRNDLRATTLEGSALSGLPITGQERLPRAKGSA